MDLVDLELPSRIKLISKQREVYGNFIRTATISLVMGCNDNFVPRILREPHEHGYVEVLQS